MELDFSDQIKARLLNEIGSEEEISEEAWAAEEKKGKTLNKPFRTSGGPKKFSVYVKNDKGNVVKVNFGDPNMEIKRDDPARRKSFRARHNCANPGPKTKARYWSCKQWRSSTKVQGSEEDFESNLLIAMDESDAAARPGRKSSAQTPAKPDEKKKGSSKNEPGSAGTKKDAKETAKKVLDRKDEKSMVSDAAITFSAKVTKALQAKVQAHNKKHPSKKVTLGQLKKVYRRGSGAFSSSHRPGMSRGGWAMARVNMYLKMRRGGKVKESYRKADQDVAKSSYYDVSEDNFIDFSLDEQIEAKLDLKTYDLVEEEDCYFDNLFSEESEALTDKQKKLPPFLQKAIKKKAGKDDKKEDKKEDKKDDKESDAGHGGKKGLWENIRDKKRRMGKNYRPAKPGDKDRPTKEALERAKGEKDEKSKDEKSKDEKNSGLTEKQKKLPDFIKKNILKNKK